MAFEEGTTQLNSLFMHRVCPGRHFGEASLFILCASVLSAFSVSVPLDKDGKPVVLNYPTTANEMVSCVFSSGVQELTLTSVIGR